MHRIAKVKTDAMNIGIHDNIRKDIYKVFSVDGNEAEALNDSYLELFELIGRDAMLKLFKCFRGDKIECLMKPYRPELLQIGEAGDG